MPSLASVSARKSASIPYSNGATIQNKNNTKNMHLSKKFQVQPTCLRVRTWHWLRRAFLAARVLRVALAWEPEGVGLPVRILLLLVRSIGDGV